LKLTLLVNGNFEIHLLGTIQTPKVLMQSGIGEYMLASLEAIAYMKG